MARPNLPRRRPLAAANWAALIVVAGALLTWGSYLFVRSGEDEAARRQFDAEADVIGRDVRDVMQHSGGLTRAAAAMVRSLPRLDARTWHSFVDELRPFESTDGLVGYGIIEQVARTGRDAFTEQMARAGQGRVRIFPPRDKETYWPLSYAEPDALHQKALGFDVGSEPSRLTALLQARDTANITSTGVLAINFLAAGDPPLGYLAFYPIYFGDGMPDSADARRQRLRGFAVAAFRFDNLLTPIVTAGHGRFDLTLIDLDGEEPRVGFRSAQSTKLTDRGPRRWIDFTVWQHPWRVELAATPLYLRQIDRQRSMLAMTVGALLTLVTASLFYSVAGGRQRAEALAEQMTTDLRISEERFRALTQLSSDWYWEQDCDYRFTTVVAGDEDIAHGMPVAIGKTRWEMPIRLSEAEWQAHRAVLDAREPFRDFEFRIHDEARGWRWRSVNGEPFYATDGRFLGYRGTGRDITERKSSEMQLALKSFALDQVREQAHLFDADNGILYVNEEACRALGYEREELLQLSIFDYDPEVGPVQLARIQEAMREGGYFTFESSHRRKDGQTFPVEVRVSSFSFEGRQYVLALASDITQRRNHAAELARHRDHLQEMVDERTRDLRAAKEEAERASQAKTEFLANVTHELRTPMHAILSYANLGRDRQDQASPAKLAGYFERILDSGERLLNLINELLDLSKFEAGRMLLSRQSANAVELCRTVATDLAALATTANVTIEVVADADIGQAVIDTQRMSQLMHNLLANAIRFSPDGGTITVTLMAGLLPGRRASDQGSIPALRISVADRGVGIPEAELESIFDAFVQSSRTSTGAGGTGLGLAICRQIVHAHHGRITAHNRAGGGAEFEVLLPTQ